MDREFKTIPPRISTMLCGDMQHINNKVYRKFEQQNPTYQLDSHAGNSSETSSEELTDRKPHKGSYADNTFKNPFADASKNPFDGLEA